MNEQTAIKLGWQNRPISAKQRELFYGDWENAPQTIWVAPDGTLNPQGFPDLCVWEFDAPEVAWRTECGNAFDKMKFCPYCGRELAEIYEVED